MLSVIFITAGSAVLAFCLGYWVSRRAKSPRVVPVLLSALSGNRPAFTYHIGDIVRLQLGGGLFLLGRFNGYVKGGVDNNFPMAEIIVPGDKVWWVEFSSLTLEAAAKTDTKTADKPATIKGKKVN